MTAEYRRFQRMLYVETAGFGLILLLILLDELIDLPHLLLGAAPSPTRVEEYLIEGVALVCLALLTLIFARQAVYKVREMESWLVMCAWCNRVRIDEEWVRVESFLKNREGLRTTHGICGDCASKMKAEVAAKPAR